MFCAPPGPVMGIPITEEWTEEVQESDAFQDCHGEFILLGDRAYNDDFLRNYAPFYRLKSAQNLR